VVEENQNGVHPSRITGPIEKLDAKYKRIYTFGPEQPDFLPHNSVNLLHPYRGNIPAIGDAFKLISLQTKHQ
jgi:hypothetical protein